MPRGNWEAIAFLVIIYALLALYPFTWTPPQWVENSGNWSENQTLMFSDIGFFHGMPDRSWLNTIIQTGHLNLSLKVRSYSPDQQGPARILTISKDTRIRNLTVGQQYSDLVVRLRTVRTNLNGTPNYVIPKVFRDENWHEIDLTVHAEQLRITVDGTVRIKDQLPTDPFRNWDKTLQLGFGNEFTWDRSWLGEIAWAKIQQTNYLAKSQLIRPNGHLEGNRFTFIGVPLDLIVNFSGFLPIGYLTALWLKGPQKVRRTTAIWACVTLLVELSQLFFGSRYPGASDWVLNVIAACLGALAYTRWVEVKSAHSE